MGFGEDYEIYKQNILPSMIEALARELSVSTTSLQTFGVGFYPAKQAWVFAERDHKGEIIGLSLRSLIDGKKWMVEGSKRGLVYPYNENHLEGERRYEPGMCHWVRIQEAGVECPVCGKPDWCMVSSDSPTDPSAVLCSRIVDGSIRAIGEAGFLHLRGKIQAEDNRQVLPETSDLPILIVEGSSDVLAALDIGFVAIGKPSATGGMAILKEMPLAGKEVWIIGENDAGAGKDGMEKTYVNLKGITDRITCIMPPEGTKDLRQWVGNGLTQDALFTYVGQYDHVVGEDRNILPNDKSVTIAKWFLDHNNYDGHRTIRRYHGEWYQWDDNRYVSVCKDDLRGMIYRYLADKQYVTIVKGEENIVPYDPTARRINDVVDAMNAEVSIAGASPFWIHKGGMPDTTNLISFANGLLDVNAFCQGDIVLIPPTPELFTLARIPYAYDPQTWSETMDHYCETTFNGDAERIRMLAQWFGYNLVHDLSQEKLLILIGDTRSGKSTLLTAMKAMLGKEQCASATWSTLAGRFGLSALVGKSAVIAGDVKEASSQAEMSSALEVMLRITGQDSVPVEQKYARAYDTELTCRFTLAMNDLPQFTDNSKAVVNRCMFLKFPNCFLGKEDTGLKARLEKDAREGKLINFALWGLKDLREVGKFVEPESGIQERVELTAMTSPMMGFVSDCCLLGPALQVDKHQLYEAWKGWCKDFGFKAGNGIHFGRWLKRYAPSTESKRVRKLNENRWVYQNITLNNSAFERYLGRP